MAYVRLGDMPLIETNDAVLDRIADLLENPPAGGGGFWVAGQLEVERDGEAVHPDPAYGHQRLWVPVGERVLLVYDRPLHGDPDRVEEAANVVLL